MIRALAVVALLAAGCATVPRAPLPPLPEAPPGRLTAYSDHLPYLLAPGDPAHAELACTPLPEPELVCMPPELASWLWGMRERAEGYREKCNEIPACELNGWVAGGACAVCAGAAAAACAVTR
jgi:hypothetical protein